MFSGLNIWDNQLVCSSLGKTNFSCSKHFFVSCCTWYRVKSFSFWAFFFLHVYWGHSVQDIIRELYWWDFMVLASVIHHIYQMRLNRNMWSKLKAYILLLCTAGTFAIWVLWSNRKFAVFLFMSVIKLLLQVDVEKF